MTTDMSDTSGTAATAAAAGKRGGKRQVKVGTVVSDAMQKTVVVAVPNPVAHRLYHRSIKRTSKFHAHDENNECRVGDTVEIVSSRPLSRTKRWRVREILKRAE
jgi:small subunit ribosomal protein S17